MARYGLGGWVHQWAGAGFPWGTLTVNVVGSFALGSALGLLQAAAAGPDLRAFLTIGLLGAFTTFSTFTWETVAMLQDGQWVRAALYLSGSVAIGLLAVVAGLGLAGVVVHGRAA